MLAMDPRENVKGCLEAVLGWVRSYKLKIISNKIGLMLVRGRFDPGNGISSLLDGFALSLKEKFCSLRFVRQRTLVFKIEKLAFLVFLLQDCGDCVAR